MTASGVPEPCISCARTTRVGTSLFSDRRVTRSEDGEVLHLCGDCNERAISHYGRQPTERDMAQIAAHSVLDSWVEGGKGRR